MPKCVSSRGSSGSREFSVEKQVPGGWTQGLVLDRALPLKPCPQPVEKLLINPWFATKSILDCQQKCFPFLSNGVGFSNGKLTVAHEGLRGQPVLCVIISISKLPSSSLFSIK
jgi:hypothetical protein